MSKDGPPQAEIDPEFEAKLSAYETALYKGFWEMKNEYGNRKYDASIREPESPDELGRIWINSVTQYSPSGDTDPATGEFDHNAGPADFHYGEEGDYGAGVVIFKKLEDGSITWELEGDLSEKEEILKLVSRVVGSN